MNNMATIIDVWEYKTPRHMIRGQDDINSVNASENTIDEYHCHELLYLKNNPVDAYILALLKSNTGIATGIHGAFSPIDRILRSTDILSRYSIYELSTSLLLRKEGMKPRMLMTDTFNKLNHTIYWVDTFGVWSSPNEIDIR